MRVPLLAFQAVGLCLASAILLQAQAPADAVRTWSFDGDAIGRPPPEFTFASVRHQEVGRWQILRDGRNHVLGQLAADRQGAQIALVVGVSARDVVLSVRLKPIAGERSGGIVWRYQDEQNYYLARLNLSERNVRLFKVVRGNRVRLEGEDDLELPGDQWHVLKVRHRHDRIDLRLNGIPIGDERDRTFLDPGRAGVWAAGRSSIWFDDLRLEPAR